MFLNGPAAVMVDPLWDATVKGYCDVNVDDPACYAPGGYYAQQVTTSGKGDSYTLPVEVFSSTVSVPMLIGGAAIAYLLLSGLGRRAKARGGV